ncbi:MAG: 5'/3'-nucleotidase SurE [Anaerolineae bacterium]
MIQPDVAEPPFILVTNDDGIHSPGLHAAVKAVCDLGEIMVAAPRQQQTGASRSYPPVHDKAIYPEEIPVNCRTVTAYGFEASPAQAVMAALLDLAPRPPNLLISGINFGENLGTSVTTSGTVGAAIEAASFGVPALAVSVETPKEFHYQHSDTVDFTAAAAFTRRFAQIVLAGGLPPDVDILKIEVPSDASPDTAWRIARVSRQRYYVPLPSGRRSLSDQKGIDYTRVINWDVLEADSDVRAVAVDRVVSVSPISIDLTARVDLDELAADLQRRDPHKLEQLNIQNNR